MHDEQFWAQFNIFGCDDVIDVRAACCMPRKTPLKNMMYDVLGGKQQCNSSLNVVYMMHIHLFYESRSGMIQA